MKCPDCNGTGSAYPEENNEALFNLKCDRCNGTGEIEFQAIQNKDYLPVTPKEIRNFLESYFLWKSKSDQLVQKFIQFKKEWVQGIIYNNQVEDALFQYINLFFMD